MNFTRAFDCRIANGFEFFVLFNRNLLRHSISIVTNDFTFISIPRVVHLFKKELLFIGLSGIATGAAWLCYYYAIQNGEGSVGVPVDKLSIIVIVIFSYFVFKEKLSKKAFAGICLMVVGTLLMVFFK